MRCDGQSSACDILGSPSRAGTPWRAAQDQTHRLCPHVLHPCRFRLSLFLPGGVGQTLSLPLYHCGPLFLYLLGPFLHPLVRLDRQSLPAVDFQAEEDGSCPSRAEEERVCCY